jgi:hypothetical protein
MAPAVLVTPWSPAHKEQLMDITSVACKEDAGEPKELESVLTLSQHLVQKTGVRSPTHNDH